MQINLVEDSFLAGEREVFVIDYSADATINEIIVDIITIFKHFSKEISDAGYEENDFKSDLYKMLGIFVQYRPDIAYSKELAYIGTILLINSENYYSAFVSMANLIINGYLGRFLIKETNFIKTRTYFFEELLKKYAQTVFDHFAKMDISISLFMLEWLEFIYTKTFNISFLYRIWDNYLIRGEIFIFEVALAIILIQQKELVSNPLNVVLKSLNQFPTKFSEDDFFDVIDDININTEYSTMIEQSNMAYEKAQLYEALL